MNRILVPWLAAMALTSGAHAQSSLPPAADWEGFYVGLTIENFGDNELEFADLPILTGDIEGRHWGVFAGYRHQMGNFVIGGEFDATIGDTETTIDSTIALPISITQSVGSTTSFMRLGAEAGYAFGPFLPYATAGIATLTFQDTASGDNRGSGTFYGVGLDFQTGEYGTVGVELLQHNLDDFSGIDDLSIDAATFGVSFSVRY